MRGNEIVEENQIVGLPALPPLFIGIAIDGNRKSKYVVDWALQKFIPEGNVVFKLLHVHPKITKVPTPMGNYISISQVREDVAAAYKTEMEWQKVQMLLPYKKMCTKKRVQADIVLAESDDVANAIAEEIAKSNIKKLVIGASPRGMFKRNKGNSLSSMISVGTPRFCTVYAVSKGKLSSIRPSDLETNGSIRDDSSMCSEFSNTTSTCTLSSLTDGSSITSFSHMHSPPLALSNINRGQIQSSTSKHESNDSISQFSDFEEGNYSGSFPSGSESGNAMSVSSSLRSLSTDNQSWVLDQPSRSNELVPYSSLENQEDVNFELEKLKIELRHVQEIYAMAQNERVDASRKLIDLNKHRLEEAIRLKEISEKEKKAKELASREKERSEAATSEAECLRDSAEREASRKRVAALIAEREAKEKEKLENVLLGTVQQYHIFSWEEIVSATSSFSEDLKIGMGAYGTVYKCSLHHTLAAVKVLHSKEDQNTKQFQKELEILNRVRHQHLLILLGACPDHGCLVYEYMENGSLEDRLQRVNNTPPIPWFDRFRIAWEVASALVFLHNAKPKPIIHRDLKPANILLDRNLVSKIGDVGLSTVLDLDTSLVSQTYKDTGPVGTLSYIDPEYQRTGLVSAKSDVYAFGIVILQLLTAKQAIGLVHIMETAIDEGRLLEVLDLEAGNWPPKETKELAMLGLKCAELQCKERPDLTDQVLPVLARLKEAAERKRHRISTKHLGPPDHFLCPILQDVMNEPCAAADGHTYDRRAIEKWLEENDTSPMTNLLLPNKNLLPNYTLLSVIMEWKSKNE